MNKILSMTGYASATRETNAGMLSLELKSVNSRFLDLQFRISDELRSYEPQLREALTAALARGKVDCRLILNRANSASPDIVVEQAMVARLIALQVQVLAVSPRSAPMGVADILKWQGVIIENAIDPEELNRLVKSLIDESIHQLTEARTREGEKLGLMLEDRLQKMEKTVHQIQPLIPNILDQQQHRLTERLREALGQIGTNSIPKHEIIDRIKQEVTLFGIKFDISEELTRLLTHIGETRRILKEGGQMGKRLDFMMQELNREANTLGSKASAIELSNASMQLKLLIEQMREQVQNLE